MMSKWKKFLLYASLLIVGVVLIFILIETIKAKNTGLETKTLWDWMDLLIVPLVLAGGAFYLNQSERKTEREIVKDRQQEQALQSYIDRISELLLEKKLRTTEEVEVRDVARTRTLSVLRVLDTKRNDLVIQFLREARLVVDESSLFNSADMEGFTLEGLNLRGVILQEVNLRGANLQGADLAGANLRNAVLRGANLWGANLWGAVLSGADLAGANLRKVVVDGADFARANLQGVDLRGASLVKTNLKGANLESVQVSDEQLASTKFLKGATMPDGTKHE